MAYGYWKSGLHERKAVFNLLFRKKLFGGHKAVSAGLAPLIEYLQNYRFTKDDIAYLKTLQTTTGKSLFEPEFLRYLSKLRFECDIAAVAEGEVVFSHEPLLRIKGPLLQCQLLETPLLNIINFQTLIATKAARVCQAANWESVLEFGLRRGQGFDGGLSASRAAYIGGCAATSNTLAGKLYGIPVRGTHAHSWIMAFPTEQAAFAAFATVFPDNCIFLVDTYDTIRGVKEAIKIGKQLTAKGKHFLGIRLDSGDLLKLSLRARKLLDQAGFKDSLIMGSGDLDEYIIQDLKTKGAPIIVWGVGTRMVTAFDQPALDGVYKLAALQTPKGKWEYKLKLSEDIGKISAPGILKIRRYFKNNIAVADVIYDELLDIPKKFTVSAIQNPKHKYKIDESLHYTELMQPIFKAGKLIYQSPDLAASRQKTINELARFSKGVQKILNPAPYFVGMEPKLLALKLKLIKRKRT